MGMNFEEAEKKDMMNSKFFKPETNVPVDLTFAPVGVVLQGQNPIGYDIVEEDVPDFNDKTKRVRRVVLKLHIDSVGGEKVDQEWSIMSPKLRELFKIPCQTGNILKKIYRYKATGEGKQKTHQLSEMGDRQ